MSYSHRLVACDFLSHPTIYVSLKAFTKEAFQRMEQNKVRTLTVTDETFCIVGIISKSQIEKYLLKNKIKKNSERYEKLRVCDVLEQKDHFVTAYPGTDLQEIKRILIATSSDYLPIAKNPWSKKLLGFVLLDTVLNLA